MKTPFKYLLFAGAILFRLQGISQNNCKPENIYITDSVGNGNFKIPQRLIHKISNDRLLIYLSDTVKMPPLMNFNVVRKECNEDSKPGFYTIQLDLVFEENAKAVESKLKIKCNYLGAYQIELLYPNKEDRIFYIDQQKAYLKNK